MMIKCNPVNRNRLNIQENEDMMKKQYEMPNLYVVAFTGEVDTATTSKCDEQGIDIGKAASTFGLTPCPDPGPTPGGSGTTDPVFGPIQ